jgi:SAM-dependent methyltransferase
VDRDLEQLLEEQKRYYEERAPEYDDLWFRRGRHDLGPEFARKWSAETAALEAAADAFAPAGHVLELAAGSGLWTRRLAPCADRLVAVDASPAMLERNRERVGDKRIEYVIADLFDGWHPVGSFDSIVFGFFISHIPPEHFDTFWRRLRGWLAPGGRVWFCDDVAGELRPFTGEQAVEDDSGFLHTRDLADGRTFEIVKIFYEPGSLQGKLEELGWDAQVRATGDFFYAGTATPRS